MRQISATLTLSRWRPISYRNPVNWFLYDIDLHHESVNYIYTFLPITLNKKILLLNINVNVLFPVGMFSANKYMLKVNIKGNIQNS